MGIKVVSGDITFIVSQSGYKLSMKTDKPWVHLYHYALPNGMKIGAFTFKGEDDLDVGEEYSRNGVEVQYTIASGLDSIS